MRIRVMFARFQMGGVIQQAIQNVGGLAHVAGNDLRVERDPQIRDMSVNTNALSCGGEVLGMKGRVECTDGDSIHPRIRTGSRALSPDFSQRLLELEVHQGRGRLR